jgi:glycosyl transferase family 1
LLVGTAETIDDEAQSANRRAHKALRPLRVTVVGPPELLAERTVALLRGLGIDARRPSRPSQDLGALSSRLERIRRGLATDAFLHVSGGRDLKRLQVWLMQLGVPTVMAWIGSDVLKHAPHASSSVIARAWHWCVAPWLREELTEAGIAADVVRLTPPQIPHPMPALPTSFTVLAYAADDRDGLYGREFIFELARRRPDIRFLLLAASPTDVLPANVTALGWVEDMHEVLTQTTLYVRPTSHDGLSNLVLEALAYGRYVLWTYPFPGVDAAASLDTAEARLNELGRQHAEGRLFPNHEGREAVVTMFDPTLVSDGTLERLTQIVAQGWTRPPGQVQRRIIRSSLGMLRVALRADRTWTTAHS